MLLTKTKTHLCVIAWHFKIVFATFAFNLVAMPPFNYETPSSFEYENIYFLINYHLLYTHKTTSNSQTEIIALITVQAAASTFFDVPLTQLFPFKNHIRELYKLIVLFVCTRGVLSVMNYFHFLFTKTFFFFIFLIVSQRYFI